VCALKTMLEVLKDVNPYAKELKLAGDYGRASTNSNLTLLEVGAITSDSCTGNMDRKSVAYTNHHCIRMIRPVQNPRIAEKMSLPMRMIVLC
jgi:hypothetical protein